ncbi:MAG: DUF262 domain-containing protein [Clostridium sp.]|nr:DUF262 domain-containing protein [Clostridium sp.]
MQTPDEMFHLFMENCRTIDRLRSLKILLDKDEILGEIRYDPPFQREFLWNKTKKSYLIESVILNMDIPPITLFEEDDCYEIIDGRQRYQTLLEFVNNGFSLDAKGLPVLKYLHGKYFRDFDEKFQKAFLNDVYLRTREIEILPNKKLSKTQKDFIKKSFFRRYNAGLSCLTRVELDKAKYTDNKIINYFRNNLKGNVELIEKILMLFKPNYSKKNFDEADNIERILQVFRFLFVIEDIPINSFFKKENKNEIIECYFFTKQQKRNNCKTIFNSFIKKIELLNRLKSILDSNNIEYNMIFFNTIYWAVTVSQKEGITNKQFDSDAFFIAFKNFAKKNIELFTKPDKEVYYMVRIRELYKLTAGFFEQYFNISLKKYIESEKTRNPLLNAILDFTSEKAKNFKFDFREITKHVPDSLPIIEILNKFEQNNVLLCPPYQRKEKITKTKSSRIIESILLGYTIPPIYVLVHENGIWEIVDGQQRLLTIIGFCGKTYMDEAGRVKMSKKHKFALQNLEVLRSYNGVTFENLSERDKKRILNFVIPVIFIYQKNNKLFEPHSLFLRHNSKPYPISNNSFEMWNTIMPEDVSLFIRKLYSQHYQWFYIVMKKNNIRKKNEQLYTTLMYLEAMTTNEIRKENPYINFRNKLDSMQVEIKKPARISNFLYNLYFATAEEKDEVSKKIENYIYKLKLLLENKSSFNDSFLRDELEKLILVNEGKTRNKQTMIILWYLVSPLKNDVIINYNEEIKKSIKNILRLFIFKKDKLIRKTDVKQRFNSAIDEYWANFVSLDNNNKNEREKKNDEPLIKGKKATKKIVRTNVVNKRKSDIQKENDKNKTVNDNGPKNVAININLFNQDTTIDYEN